MFLKDETSLLVKQFNQTSNFSIKKAQHMMRIIVDGCT
jgi:hypothetical protein